MKGIQYLEVLLADSERRKKECIREIDIQTAVIKQYNEIIYKIEKALDEINRQEANNE